MEYTEMQAVMGMWLFQAVSDPWSESTDCGNESTSRTDARTFLQPVFPYSYWGAEVAK